MPFLTRNPSYYLSALQEESTDALHVGLFLGESDVTPHDTASELRSNSATIPAAETSWIELAAAIKNTRRSIRCLWLRFKSENDGNDGRVGGTTLAAFRALGQGLTGATTIESLVLEDQGMGSDQIACLRDYLARNTTLRGVKFLRTDLDMPSSLLLNDFFMGNSALRVLDLTANPRVDDATIEGVLSAILRNDSCQLETLNIFEKMEGDEDAEIGISEDGVDFIASFVSRTPSLSILRLRIRELSDTGIGELANIFKADQCNISRLEISGRFGDEGMFRIAEALRTNQSLKKMDIGMSDRLTERGGRAILKAVQGQDETWQSKITSNHTLQGLYITERAGLSMSKSLCSELQFITSVDPLQTLQRKSWNYIDENIEDLSPINLEMKLGPQLLAFVSSRGGVDALFRLMRSKYNGPFTSYPTPEKIRLTEKMEKVKHENEILRAILKSERRHRSHRQMSESTMSMSQSSNHSDDLRMPEVEDDQHQKKAMARCLLLPLFKVFDICKFFMDLLKEAPRNAQSDMER